MNIQNFTPSCPAVFPVFPHSIPPSANNETGSLGRLRAIRTEHPGMDKTIVLLAALAKKKEIRILLADDDEDDRELFAEAVQQHSQVQIEMVEDGVKLMKKLNSLAELPDIIFLDLNMPAKHGKKCLEEIRKNPKFSRVQVVIYSTSQSAKDIDDTFKMGANLYIRKPNTFKELTEVIKKVFSIDWDNHKPNTHKQSFLFSAKSTK